MQLPPLLSACMDCEFQLRRRYIIGILIVGPTLLLLLYVSDGIDARRLY